MGEVTNISEGRRNVSFADKLLALYGKVAYVQKTGRNENLRYNFMREADLKQRLNAACRELRLILVEVKAQAVYSGTLPAKDGRTPQAYVVAHVSVVIGDADAVADAKGLQAVTLEGIGGGADSGDKAPMKAVVSAFKYALANGLSIATGDDPEGDPEGDRADVEDVVDLERRIAYAGDEATLSLYKPNVLSFSGHPMYDQLKAAYRARAKLLRPQDGDAGKGGDAA